MSSVARRQLSHCRNKPETQGPVCASLLTLSSLSCFFQPDSFFSRRISSAQLRNSRVPVSETLTRARHLFTRSGSGYLIVKARHALRHLCQNNINGRRTPTSNARSDARAAAPGCAGCTRRHTHAARIDGKSCGASRHGLLTARTGSAAHADYLQFA